ncbi:MULTISPECIES: aminopeptidase P family protein [unclassified Clostridioides]|uniref:aminopeptidase P family protein n=1 Tax=unclassified Clostridioides TaxID=2635829 RepID=UPI001D0CAE3E|nr:aminopeptidase P family protein [Clostridioides sp. ES-S-0001-02]MCC0639208.1 aminopeptidase P family protein [Clostridioides sp. ES-S-0049-03]MCC0652949.1 aminopeptidase P family protein [Clostridioides sp. ES-S-0001-03]MCC0657067.1 aminopeptidase P family protein [Clostridioides sp. ES-S-0123-01]MCC0675598.1 aminopeptidase P family protein [Clostridioides sp. ES-W-0018-02]MCC0695362.1 aminopeptidase P family protein [Clostridioides sp. ES-S-0048-02]MCC0707599.1 aminopeptidase P family pr
MNKIEKIRKYLKEYNVDGILINSSTNKFYIGNLFSSSGYVFITKDKQYIIVDFRYFEEVKRKSDLFDVILMDKNRTYFDIINDICRNQNIKEIGFEGSEVSFDSYKSMNNKLNVTLKSIDLSTLRKEKDEDEIKYIKKACEIVDATFYHIIDFIKVGMTERQVENEIVRFIKELGGQKESFDTIVASGLRGALPHGKASEKIIEYGDFVTFDFGAKYNNYCSDITRTICMGTTNKELEKIYNIVKKANEECIKVLKPGMTAGEIDKVARDIISSYGYGDNFGHNLGHGVGIMVHEYPALTSESNEVLKEGMVVTIEPGIYVPELGGVRIEDDVLITQDGCMRLTISTKDLIVVN